MNITSYSPTLSALIKGRYDLEKSDASLRIYTKFSNKNKGLFAEFNKVHNLYIKVRGDRDGKKGYN